MVQEAMEFKMANLEAEMNGEQPAAGPSKPTTDVAKLMLTQLTPSSDGSPEPARAGGDDGAAPEGDDDAVRRCRLTSG